ncbi:MAG: hypothetical protein ABWK01_03150 [Infirmifilum sp.]
MRTISAAIMALILLLTLARTTSHKLYSISAQVVQERNLAVIAAYTMIYANCSDVSEVLKSLNATEPLPDYPSSSVIVWCGSEPKIITFTWRG